MTDHSTETFEQNHPRLFRIAYGMLGRVAPAEDAVQEAFLRWQKVDTGSIKSAGAYLSTIVSRICLDEIKSARNRREQYIGPDLPEPLLQTDNRTPEGNAELADSLSMALLVVLKKLTPIQRAVFILHEIFDYDYSHISGIINKPETNCRKIAQRAREQVGKNKPRFKPAEEQHQKLVKLFIEAVKDGQTADLENMLAEDAIFYSDGGGKVTSAGKPIKGFQKITRFLMGIRKKAPEGTHFEFRHVNGHPGVVAYIGDNLHSVWSFFIEEGKIRNMYVVLNPEKLEHLKKRAV
ncbi:MAG: RNA polymerase sigma-70 factor [Balneolaceae bacterium]